MVSNAEEQALRSHANASTGDAIYRVFQDSAMVTAVVENIVVVPVIGIATLAVQLTIASLFSLWFGFCFLSVFWFAYSSSPLSRPDCRRLVFELVSECFAVYPSTRNISKYSSDKNLQLRG